MSRPLLLLCALFLLPSVSTPLDISGRFLDIYEIVGPSSLVKRRPSEPRISTVFHAMYHRPQDKPRKAKVKRMACHIYEFFWSIDLKRFAVNKRNFGSD
ncbi:hypothetical protein Trydic_g23698 [Trypoxylus dichotomus]